MPEGETEGHRGSSIPSGSDSPEQKNSTVANRCVSTYSHIIQTGFNSLSSGGKYPATFSPCLSLDTLGENTVVKVPWDIG